MKIYKYRPINRNTLESLINSTLYFSNPNCFNDPFDSNIEMSFDGASVEEIKKIQRISGSPFPDNFWDPLFKDPKYIKKFADDLNVTHYDFYSKYSTMCCFSKNRENILMWSHYSDSHKGIALGFNVLDYLNEQNYLLFEMDDDRFRGFSKSQIEHPDCIPVWPVEYKNEKPQKLLVTEEPYSILKKLCTKSTYWSYEEEVRMVFFNPIGNRNVKYKQESLSEIVFGVNVSESDIALVEKIVAKFYTTTIKLYKTKINKNEYKIEYIEI